MRIAIGIPTIGRANIVRETVRDLRLQHRQPDAVFVCAPRHDDVAGLAATEPAVHILLGGPGLSRQRNIILSVLDDFDLVVFLDDDFVCDPHFLHEIEAVFMSVKDVVCATGHVVADGVLGPGLNMDAARHALISLGVLRNEIVEVYNAYGCNMAIRISTQRDYNVRFDEELPLYAWLEDVDFSRQIAAYGRVVQVTAAVGVHRGVKGGRLSGVRLGYSQVANPVYLMRKGTCSPAKGIGQIARNMAANMARCITPEAHVDRVGRTSGNVRGLVDLIKGRLAPARVLDL
ncbi:MAG: glycosyltransferase [Beijerinckiaceae bacterium]